MKAYMPLFFTVFLIVSCQKKEQLIWEENFDGNQLNEKYWNFEIGDGCPTLCGWGNNENQIYTKVKYYVR